MEVYGIRNGLVNELGKVEWREFAVDGFDVG